MEKYTKEKMFYSLWIVDALLQSINLELLGKHAVMAKNSLSYIGKFDIKCKLL